MSTFFWLFFALLWYVYLRDSLIFYTKCNAIKWCRHSKDSAIFKTFSLLKNNMFDQINILLLYFISVPCTTRK